MSKEEKKNQHPNRENSNGNQERGSRELKIDYNSGKESYYDKIEKGEVNRRPTMETPIPPPPKKDK